MNRIFRVIFDKSKGVFIAVSELTRCQVKSSKFISTPTPQKIALPPRLSSVSLFVLGTLFSPSIFAGGEWITIDKFNISAYNQHDDDCAHIRSVNLTIHPIYRNSSSGNINNDQDLNKVSCYAVEEDGIVAIGYDARGTAADSVVIGSNARAEIESSGSEKTVDSANSSRITVVGFGSKGYSDQATVFGSSSGARSQATAIGNDVYAYGKSSIAIGSDDLLGTDINNNDKEELLKKFGDKLNSSIIDKIFGDLKNDTKFFTNGNFDHKYKENESKDDMRIYSPTFAAKRGAIAIGSRAVAGGELSTSLGSLSFALADHSTAVGIRSFVASDAQGGTAMGENSYVFAANSIAIGNDVEAANQGAFAYGYKAKAAGEGSLAFGYGVGAAVALIDEFYNSTNNTLKLLHQSTELIKHDGTMDKEAETKLKTQIAQMLADVEDRLAGKNNKALYQTEDKTYITTSYGDIRKTKNNKDTPNGANASNAIAIGRYTFALKSDSLALGSLAIADGVSSLAIGSQSHTGNSAINSMAIGVNSHAAGTNATALGYATSAETDGSLALGVGAKVVKRMTILSVNGDSIVSNDLAAEEQINAKNGIAIGLSATVEAENSMAIGNFSHALRGLANSVALGVNSHTDYSLENLRHAGWVATGAIAIPTSVATGVISVGAINNERRITNLASGYADSDAVNVAQLKTLDERINAIIGNDNAGGLFQYLSIEKKNPRSEAGKLAAVMDKEKDYQQYISLKKQYLGFKAREQYNGEKIDATALQQMNNKAETLDKKHGNGLSAKATQLKQLEDQLKQSGEKKTDKAEYTKQVEALVKAFETDQKQDILSDEEKIAKNNIKGTNFLNDGAKGLNSIAFGWKAKTAGSENDSDNVGGKYAIAIGVESEANAENALAIGYKNQVSAKNGIAIGSQLTVNGANSGAFGDPSIVNSANSYAIGNRNNLNLTENTGTTNATAKGIFAFGNKITHVIDNSVFLGNDSGYFSNGGITSGNSNYSGFSFSSGNKHSYNGFAGANPVGVVSIGNANETRRLQGVAAGLIGEKSTDAVNGSQLYALMKKLNEGSSSPKVEEGKTPSDQPATPSSGFHELTVQGNSGTATLNKDKTNLAIKGEGEVKGSTAKDNIMTAINEQSLTIKLANDLQHLKSAIFEAANSAAGNSAIEAMQLNSEGMEFITINNGTPTAAENTPKISRSGIDAGNQKMTAVKAGEVSEQSTEAINGSQLYDSVNALQSVLGNDFTQTGGKIEVKSGDDFKGIGGTGKTTVSDAIDSLRRSINQSGGSGQPAATQKVEMVSRDANIIVTPKDNGNDKTFEVAMNKDLIVDSVTAAKSLSINNVTINTTATHPHHQGKQVLNVAGNGNNTVISGVADGIAPNDAVNVKQLNQRDNQLNKRINRLTAESRAGIAGAMAMAGLPQAVVAGRTTMGVGMANFKSENAVAVGVSKMSDNGKITVRFAGMMSSNGDAASSIGFGYTF